MIKVDNLTKKYKKKIAVNDISFDVDSGKVTGFLGPNGAGKSTAMRVMLGIDQGKGDVKFNGKHLNDYSRPNQIVGALLEAKAFHPKRTARNHLMVLAIASGLDAKRVDEVLDVVGLSDVANKKAGTFSLGMAQRLGIAAAILTEPKYLVLDEPANGLDPEGIAWLRSFLKDYARRGNSVFISSHLLGEIAQLADNVIVIGRGEILESCTIAELTKKSGTKGIFVRATNGAKLRKALESSKLSFDEEEDGFLVHKATAEDIGRLAKKQDLTIVELSNRMASLEEAFLQVTSGSQEFKGHNEKADKK